MAALVRLQCIPAIKQVANLYPKQVRFISTSKKNRETISVTEDVDKVKTETAVQKKNWVSYGFDFKDQTEDRSAMHVTMFLGVTGCFVFGTFFWSYLPDFKLKNWSQREAYLEIRRRESRGLPHVDPNLIDPSKVVLPSDEELGDTEIII